MDGPWQWAEEQWSTCDLGNRRRTRRAVTLGARIAEHSDQSLPRQMVGMADLKAAYRLLDGKAVTLEALTGPHRDPACCMEEEEARAPPTPLLIRRRGRSPGAQGRAFG
ncbi:IS4/Tn5 family transposase DNA-binding protein [Skermanella aerolata]|uniref:IS4/Tn5 family transposase DNA-binding protein n=1 Tax=Skermanella aerolata TaxID=393310 RepID=UPI003D18FD96